MLDSIILDIVSSYCRDSKTQLALVTGAVVLTVYMVMSLNGKNYKLPPGPRGWPIIGNLLEMAADPRPYMLMTKLRKTYGDVYLLHIGQKPVVVLNSVAAVKEALVTNGDDFAGRPQMYSTGFISMGHRDIGFGQFTPIWKLQRKIAYAGIRKYASGQRLEALLRNSMDYLTEVLDKKVSTPVEITPMTSLLVYNVICNMCFGQQYSPEDQRFKELLSLFDRLNRDFADGLLADFIPVLRYLPSKQVTELKGNADYFSQFLLGTVREHKQSFDSNNLTDLTYELLSQHKEAEKDGNPVYQQLSEIHYVQILSDLFFAGTDSIRFTLSWFLQYVAANPEVQTKIQTEIDGLVGIDCQVTLEMRNSLHYTQAVLNEVMRLSPLSPMAFPHETLKDTTVGGFDVPEGYYVFVNIWSLHHDPQQWDEPEQFRPERFLDEEGCLKPEPESWMPFSCGRRVCIGKALSKAQLPTLAAMLLHRFTFRPPPNTQLTLESEPVGAVIMPKPFYLEVERRK